MKPNLHIMCDDNQSNFYVERCLLYVPESEDTFIGFGNPLKNLNHPRFILEVVSEEAFDRWAEKINRGDYRQVIVNYFDIHAAEVVNRIQLRDLAIVWVLWGADLYTLPFFWNKLYDGFAAELYEVSWFNHMRKMYRRWKNRVRWGAKDHRYLYSAMRKVTHGATLVEPDLALVRKHLNRKVLQIPLSFSGIEDFISVPELPKNMTIQIGNSGHPSNNHIEMLHMLKSLDVRNQMFMPIAYGTRKYLDVLPSAALTIFDNLQLELQTTMVSKTAYFERLSSIGFAVMGHLRQQAFGNLIALFYFGTKVFLREANPLLGTFRSWGLHVFSVEHDLSAEALAHILPVDQQQQNRSIIFERLNEEVMRGYFRNLLLGSRDELGKI
jgi:dTDP-N-acetylfucosamine:lipid II N-acetylfucosaminyltransferase